MNVLVGKQDKQQQDDATMAIPPAGRLRRKRKPVRRTEHVASEIVRGKKLRCSSIIRVEKRGLTPDIHKTGEGTSYGTYVRTYVRTYVQYVRKCCSQNVSRGSLFVLLLLSASSFSISHLATTVCTSYDISPRRPEENDPKSEARASQNDNPSPTVTTHHAPGCSWYCYRSNHKMKALKNSTRIQSNPIS